MKCFYPISLLLIMFMHVQLLSQSDHPKVAELIVQLSPSASMDRVIGQNSRAKKSNSSVLSERKNLHLLTFAPGTDLSSMMIELSQHPDVLHVQPNRRMQKRGTYATPNDPLFSNQWNLERIGLPELWNKTTGGTTPCGDTIVIAINDFGFDLDHEDMQGLIWKNLQEIPNNGFDDDANGYTDDYLGLNLDTGDDKHLVDEEDYHGTAVASVAAGNTNNAIGLAGVNWQVKLLIISSQESDEAGAIKAFEYVRTLRKKYNDTNGAEGAYIVALNNSWGYEGGFEEDFQILCDLFNDLGEVGILTVGSTENDQVNTDVFGDFPSDCSSEFLIVVTNTDEQDALSVAGFGAENVDLSAPGEQIYVADKNNSYQTTGGTSFATPHVSGAIGLLYSLDEATFCDDARLSPTESILQLKRYILEGTTPLPTLQGKTVSGGRLNLMNTAQMVTGTSDLIQQSFNIYPNPIESQLFVDARYFGNTLALTVFDVAGKQIYSEVPPPGKSRLMVIETSEWPSGTYLVQLQDDQRQGIEKVVKISR